MEIVARFTAAKEWNNASALVMNRAARTIQGLSADEDAILAEFHSRLTSTRGEEELQNVVAFWGRLCEYRSCWLQSSEDASQLLDSFKFHELWNDLTPQQKRRRKGWWCTVNTLLHKGAGWTHAAQAIMEYGLPRLEQPEHPDDATEHITAIGQFAVNLASWLKGFASRMHAYMQTERYQTERYRSMVALDNRRRRTASPE